MYGFALLVSIGCQDRLAPLPDQAPSPPTHWNWHEGPTAPPVAVVDVAGETRVVGGSALFRVTPGQYEHVHTALFEPHDGATIAVAVGDGTGGPEPEVVVVTDAATVFVLDPASGLQLSRLDLPVTAACQAALGDVDADGRLDVVVLDELQWALRGFRLDGTELIRINNVVDCNGSAPILAQLDADPAIEWASAVNLLGTWFGIVYDMDGGARDVVLPFGQHVDAVDVNGDGLLELLSLDLAGLTATDLRLHQQVAARPDLAGVSLTHGDVDGDGHYEVIVGQGDWLIWHPSTGVVDVIPTGGGSREATALDPNRDGRDTLFAMSADADLREIDPLTGAVTIRSPPVHGPYLALSRGDLDGDGAAELLTMGVGGEARFLVFDAATGGIRSWSPPIPGVWAGAALELADLDGDGAAEILLTRSGLEIWSMDAAGTFTLRQTARHAGFVQWLVVADIDSDGTLEIIGDQARAGGSDLRVWRPDGSLMWRSAPMGLVRRLELADLSQDGQPELLVLVQGEGVRVLSLQTRRWLGTIPGNFLDMTWVGAAHPPSLVTWIGQGSLERYAAVGGQVRRIARVPAPPERGHCFGTPDGNVACMEDTVHGVDITTGTVTWTSAIWPALKSRPVWDGPEFWVNAAHGVMSYQP